MSCDTFNTEKYKGITYLDVSATYSRQTNTVFINVVNRHKDKAITVDITNTSGMFTGKGEINVIAGKELQEAFSFDKQNDYVPEKKYVEVKNNELEYTFLPHSFTQIKITLKLK